MAGQPIAVRLRATNTSRQPTVLRFTSGQRFDFTVFRVGQRESVYTWSATRMFLQAVGSLALRPGQSQNYEAAIGDEMGTLGPGRYRLIARLANSPRPIVAAPVEFEVADSGLAITARTDKTSYRIGEPVRIEASVTNRLDRANTARFESGLEMDAIITDEAGRQVWTYGANLRFIRVLGEVTWQPRQVKSYSFEWNGVPFPGEDGQARLAPGRYRVQAVLQSTPQLLAPPVEIEITS